jgi:hypothetical protein
MMAPEGAMEILLLLLTIGLPIMKLVLFPAKAIGRGGNWVIVGALAIVGMAMALWLAVQSASDVGDDPASAPELTRAVTAAHQQLPDLEKLARELQPPA